MLVGVTLGKTCIILRQSYKMIMGAVLALASDCIQYRFPAKLTFI